MELPEISIKGRKNYQNLKRKLALMNTQERAFFYQSEAPYSILKGYGMTGKRTDSVLVDNSIRAMDEGCISECKERSDGLLQAGQVTISYSSF